MNFTSLFLLSNVISKLEKISFLPRINGLFSLLDKAQVISIGVFVILMVILVRYAIIVPPSMPQNFILGNVETLIAKSLATDLGIIVQSAPVSTIKSNFWYPYLVKTGIGITGSGIIPSCVCFWFKGKLERIDTDCLFRRDKTNSQFCSIDPFLGKLCYQLRIGLSVGKNLAVFSGNIFSRIIPLQLCIRDNFHIFHLKGKYTLSPLGSQEEIATKTRGSLKFSV